MEQNNLQSFVSERLKAGISKVDLVEQLQTVGWSEEEALIAYRAALVQNGVPTPSEGTKRVATKRASTVEIILNIFSFILLGIIASALGILYFEVINYFFPDPLNLNIYSYTVQATADSIHYAIAALVVAFPLYVIAVRMWFRKYREEEGKEESKLTKWITYLVLLAASITIVGDLITTLNTFLGGEISTRFYLKALTILVIAGMIFGFYFLERKKVQYGQDITRTTFQRFGWAIGAIILLGIVLGFSAAGSPQTGRMITFDTQRADNLTQIASCVNEYTQEFRRLPASQAELGQRTTYSYCASLKDPESGAAYEYRVVQPLATSAQSDVLQGTFELCATFALAPPATTPTNYPYGYSEAKWQQHGAGRTCQEETVVVKPAVQTDTSVKPIPVPALKVPVQ
jgi:hypothetical protein